MFYVKEINHRHTGTAEVNVEVKMGRRVRLLP